MLKMIMGKSTLNLLRTRLSLDRPPKRKPAAASTLVLAGVLAPSFLEGPGAAPPLYPAHFDGQGPPGPDRLSRRRAGCGRPEPPGHGPARDPGRDRPRSRGGGGSGSLPGVTTLTGYDINPVRWASFPILTTSIPAPRKCSGCCFCRWRAFSPRVLEFRRLSLRGPDHPGLLLAA